MTINNLNEKRILNYSFMTIINLYQTYAPSEPLRALLEDRIIRMAIWRYRIYGVLGCKKWGLGLWGSGPEERLPFNSVYIRKYSY